MLHSKIAVCQSALAGGKTRPGPADWKCTVQTKLEPGGGKNLQKQLLAETNGVSGSSANIYNQLVILIL